LDLAPGTELEIDALQDTIQIHRRCQPRRQLAWTDNGRPYFPAVPGHAIGDADVQRIRDAVQR
jgi:hypothetical protein